MKSLFFALLIGFSINLSAQLSVYEIASLNWNQPEGIPYTKGYSANFGADSYCFAENGRMAILSNSDLRIRVFDNTGAELLNTVNITFPAKDFCFFNNGFALLEKDFVRIMDNYGNLIETVEIPRFIKSVEKLKLIEGQLYLLSNNQQSFALVNSKFILENDGWIVDSDLFTKTIKINAGEFALQIISSDGAIFNQIYSFNGQLSSVQVIGKVDEEIFLDIISIQQNKPLVTKREIVAFNIQTKEMNFSENIEIPFVYYTYMNNYFFCDGKNLYYFLSHPDFARIFAFDKTVGLSFEPDLFLTPYSYSNSTLNSNILENADDPSSIKAPIYRSQIIGIAETFNTHIWECSADNIQDEDCGSGHVTTPAWVVVGTNVSIPYMWGGFSSLIQYDQGLLEGKCAGDKYTATYAGTACAEGLDCSGFVSRAWGKTSKYGTSTLPSISSEYPSFDDLKPGDIVNLAGSHVRLVYTNNMDGTILTLEATAAGSAWSVTYNTYTSTAMQSGGYLPRYYDEVLEDLVNPPSLVSPLNTQSGINIPAAMDWTDVGGADNYRIQVSLTETGWTAENGFTTDTDPNSTVVVNTTTLTSSMFLWEAGLPGTFEAPLPNTTYYWCVRVNVPGTGTSVYTNLRSFTTQSDNSPPSVSFSTEEWATEDFEQNFTDYDDMAIKYPFWMVGDKQSADWHANPDMGFFYDDFTEFGSYWNDAGGTWDIVSEALVQTDQGITYNNQYAFVEQTSDNVYLYNWKMKISGTGSSKRAGIYFFCDDPTMAQRNNSYMIYLRVDDNTCQIYKSTDDDIVLKTNDPTTVNVDTWYDCKVIFNPQSGLIQVFQDNVLVSEWLDDTPHTAGNSISLRTGACIGYYDDFRVYRSRTSNETVSVGADKMFRFQNPDMYTPAGMIRTVAVDYGNNFSDEAISTVNVDWTAPETPFEVRDGAIADVDLVNGNTEFQANWDVPVEPHSAIEQYEYSLGTAPGLNDLIDWTVNISESFAITGLSLPLYDSVYVSVRATNQAGLVSEITVSNGAYIDDPILINQLDNNSVMVFPNPFSDQLNLESGKRINRLQLFSIDGKLVLEEILQNNEKAIINTSNLPKAYYLLKVEFSDGTFFERSLVRE